jgi:membrane protein involved in colicin uptake
VNDAEADLQLGLSALSRRFGRVSTRLAEAGQALIDHHSLPDEGLLQELAAVRRDFESLRAHTLELATSLSIQLGGPIGALGELDAAVRSVIAESGRRVRRARAGEAPGQADDGAAGRPTEEEATGKAEEEVAARRKADEDARRRVDEAAKRKAEEEGKRKADEEAAARRKAEQDARRQAEEETKRKAAEDAKRKAEEDAKRQAEVEAKRKAEDETKRQAEAEAKRKAAEEAKRKAEEDAKRRAEEDAARGKASEEARRRPAEEAKRKTDDEAAARRRAEDDARRKAEGDAKGKAAEEARRKAEEDARRKAEEDARRKAEEDARRKAEEDAKGKATEEAKRKADDEAAAPGKAEEDAKRKVEDTKRKGEEARRKLEEVRRRIEAVPPAAAGAPSSEQGLETAQWWISASAAWGNLKSRQVRLADAVRDVLGKYPYVFSVPIQTSADYEDGLLAYGFAVLLEHVELHMSGFVANALTKLPARKGATFGRRLYDYLADPLRSRYPDFVRAVMEAGLPKPGLWVNGGIAEAETETTLFQRASAQIGDTNQKAERITQERLRFVDHHFSATVAPLTMRFFRVEAKDVKEPREVEIRMAEKGVPSDQAWIGVIGPRDFTPQLRRHDRQGSRVSGLGRECAGVWIGLFNADAETDKRVELAVTLRKKGQPAVSAFRKR